MYSCFVANYLSGTRQPRGGRPKVEHSLPIFRVEPATDLFQLRQAASARVQSEDTELLIRVVLVLPPRVVVGPTTRVRQPLRFGEIRFTLPQSLFYALALRQVEHEANTLVLTFEARSTRQYGHAAAVLAEVLPFKRLQASGTLDLCDNFLTIAAAPLGRCQIGPAQAA